ncbi:MAG: HEAT repeat domain-containing protein, partial [Planctomycetaceae bacterium]|nr:HEAT repeat domain-containing protein [Planctomycetaceae bacterium]
MNRYFTLFLGAILLSGHVQAGETVIGSRTLRVADGFEVELAAGPDLAARPIALARDEKGRLYVTDSGGMTERAEQQLAAKPHSIRRLEDTDGDGVYDRSTLFADKLMFPEGCLWHNGSLYVAAPPEIWKFTDSDDDGQAEKREVWFDGTTLTGCGNDLHGPYLGHDGRLYWCKGAFAEQKHALANKSSFVTHSAHIFRARPDGSEMEVVLTGGMDNPVNVAFHSNGERFLSCTFFQFPEAGRRDGLIHAIYGGVYGKKHNSIFEHAMTGDVMPVLNHQGAAAPCGLIAGSTALFDGEVTDNLFACYFNLHKVVRHELVANGPTFDTVDTDFLACDHPDFHPTDVFEDADGSLLVVDTGGWYKVCCPTSQLAKPDVLGAIYRVRRTGTKSVADPLGAQIDWTTNDHVTLAGYLADDRLFVQRRATAILRSRGAEAVAALSSLASGHALASVRGRAVWALAGIDAEAARKAVAAALSDPDPSVRQAAAHSAGLWRDTGSLPQLLQIAASSDAGPARAAMEAVGRIGDPGSVADVLKILGTLKSTAHDGSGAPADASERIREHSGIYALIEIGAMENLRTGLDSDSPKIQRAALVALDQMHEGGVTAEDVLSRMNAKDSALRSTAVWIVRRHPDWGVALAEYFEGRLKKAQSLATDEAELTTDLLASLAESPEIQTLLVRHLDMNHPEAMKLCLTAIERAALTSTPTAWLNTLNTQLSGADDSLIPAIVAAIRNLPLPKEGHPELQQTLASVAAKTSLPPETRLAALSAAGPNRTVDAGTFRLLLSMITDEQALNDRTTASNCLASAALTAEQLETLLAAAKHVGPMDLPKLLPAFERDGSEEFGRKLLATLTDSKGLRGLRADLIGQLLKKYPASVQTEGQKLQRLLNASLEEQTAMLESMLRTLPEGDTRRGHEVFMSKKAACNACHKLGYGGGRLGPDLTSIGR